MLKLIEGDIFQSDCEVITITINCVGVMGKGIALTAKIKFPELEKKYRELCRQKKFLPGHPRLLTVDSKKFLMFPTKDHWRGNSKIEWIDTGLKKIRQNSHLFKSLALPALGCANGKLNFSDVLILMKKHLEELENRIDIYQPYNKGD